MAKLEDEAKIKDQELGCHKIMIMFSHSDNFCFEPGICVIKTGMMKPEWTPSFCEILNMIGDTMRAVQTQALSESS